MKTKRNENVKAVSCFEELLKHMPSKYDIIIADPPYNLPSDENFELKTNSNTFLRGSKNEEK